MTFFLGLSQWWLLSQFRGKIWAGLGGLTCSPEGILLKLPTWWESFYLQASKTPQGKCLMVIVPGLSAAWGRVLNLTSRQLQMLGLDTWDSSEHRQCPEWSQWPRLREGRALECSLSRTSEPMRIPVTILGGELWSSYQSGDFSEGAWFFSQWGWQLYAASCP